MLTAKRNGYNLAALTAVCTLGYLDRDLIVLLLEPIKASLSLSDTQLGAITGLGFGLFYAVLGLPMARYADRGNRITIAAASIGLWGVTAMVCPWVTSFGQLLLLRIAAAVGESGCLPPTYSLVGDYFPDSAARVRGMTVFWLSGPFAALISFIAGGQINEAYGWRLTFFIAGTPALLLALLLKLTLTEPRLAVAPFVVSSVQPKIGIATALSGLWRQRSSRHLSLAIILIFAMGQGLSPWYAAFLMRSHAMNTAELGLWFGMIFGGSGLLGTLLGGYVSNRWFNGNERSQMRLGAVLVATLFPFFILFLLTSEKHIAIVALIPIAIAFSFFLGPTFALLQRLVPEGVRATSFAVLMLLANLLGMAAGPQIIGLLSDVLLPTFQEESLRYAMLSFSLLALWASYHFWQVGRTVMVDLSEVDKLNEFLGKVSEVNV